MKSVIENISSCIKYIVLLIVGIAAVIFAVLSSDDLYFMFIRSFLVILSLFFFACFMYYNPKKILNMIQRNKWATFFFALCSFFIIKILLNSFDTDLFSTVLGKYNYIVQLIVVVTVVMGFFGVFAWKLKYWKLYLMIAILVGLSMMMIIPIGGVPDEVTHINSAYRLSNSLLGIQNSVEGMPMRADDYALLQHSYGVGQYYDATGFETYLSQLFSPLKESTLITVNTSYVSPYFCYFLPAVGISVGRLLGLGSYQTLIIGRMMNFSAFLLITTYAVYKIPSIGKLPMIIMLLMPMTVQQGMSYSYDVYVIGLSMIAIAYAVKLAISTEPPFINKKELIVLVISSGLLLPIKHFSYFLVSFLPWIILLWKKHPLNKKTIKLIKKIIVIVCLILAAVYVVWGLTGAKTYQYKEIYLSYDPSASAYSIGYFIAHPFEIFSVCIHTIRWNLLFYLDTFVAGYLCWFDLYIPKEITIIFYCLLFLSSIKRKNSNIVLSDESKKSFAFTALFTICFVFAGLLLCWSSIASGCILGVQGRYFIPVALLLLLSVYSDKITIDGHIDKYLLITAIMTSAFTVYYITSRY